MIQLTVIADNNRVLYKDSSAPIEKRIQDLVSRMSLNEKIQQLNQYVLGENTNANNLGEAVSTIPAGIGSLIYFESNPVLRNEIQKKAMKESRLGIPVLFGYDIIHGFRTIYPISLAQACSWNPGLVEQACGVAAREGSMAGVDWTFSPMIDIARDSRWGRVSEGYGEDPYANGVFGAASVKGYQGKNLSDPYSIAACLKHFVGYGESEGGRDYHYSDVSAQSLWETYLPPYEACIKAGAATLMSSFNDISGIPGSANPYTLTTILKQQWKHDGFVISDWNAVDQLINQGFAANKKEAACKAFMAGVEMDMTDNDYADFLPQLIAEKKVPMERVNDAVSRILRIKFRLGLFEHPYTPEASESERLLLPQSIEIARKLAEESIVLLKNEKQLLPITSRYKRVALIGPMAKDKENLLGAWQAHGQVNDVESIFEGLEKEWKSNIELDYAKGCDFEGDNESDFKEALTAAQNSDIILVCLGEKGNWSGENASRSTIALPSIQEKLVSELKRTGKPIVLILSNGRPLELIRLRSQVDAIVEIWQPGVAGGASLAGILSGRINPSGKLAITFPLTTGQIPVYYNMRQSARLKEGFYQDIPTEPAYWFGHGLSYTTFTYGNLKLSATKIKKNEKLIAEVEVQNTGAMDGKETVLWFISDPVASITRPMKELKFFEKKELKAGQKSIFRMEIDPMRDLSFPDSNGLRHLEAGDFYLTIGNQKAKFELVD
ncbi:MAG: glycoside hydrolase family 3 N-terminal domain-containing protein [Bacteroidota bacterium]|nr:glycoside hydrolase family 3 N-terminal domain-containing protein [Bacteroidota bacterium]